MESATLIKAVGYSNGVTYELFEYDLNDMTGLIDNLNIWGHSVWCKFDKINII
jgi:hypothetical protein